MYLTTNKCDGVKQYALLIIRLLAVCVVVLVSKLVRIMLYSRINTEDMWLIGQNVMVVVFASSLAL